MISRQVLDNGKVTSVTKCKHFGFVQRKQNVSAMERGQQTNCQRTNLKPNPVEFAPGHSKCLALVRFGPNSIFLVEPTRRFFAVCKQMKRSITYFLPDTDVS